MNWIIPGRLENSAKFSPIHLFVFFEIFADYGRRVANIEISDEDHRFPVSGAKTFSLVRLMLLVGAGCLVLSSSVSVDAKPKVSVPWTLNNARYGAALVSDAHSLYVVGGGNAAFASLGGIEKIDLSTGEATEMPAHIIPRRFHAAVLSGREIFIFGGDAEEGLIASVEAVNIDTWKVRTVGRMPTPRRALSAIKVEDMVFTLGGSAPGDRENLPRATTVEVYDLSRKQWLRAPSMPEPKEVAVVSYDHYLYALGGYNGTGRAVTSCERYDLAAGKWENLPAAPFPLSAYSAVNVGDAIVCFGDYEQQNRVVAYQPAQAKWGVLNISFAARRHSCACVVGDWVYVVGGNRASEGQVLNIIERYSLGELKSAIDRAR